MLRLQRISAGLALAAAISISITGCSSLMELAGKQFESTAPPSRQPEVAGTASVIMLPTEREPAASATPQPTVPVPSPTHEPASQEHPDQQGFLQIPTGVGDAGNYFIYAGQQVELSWINPPQSCERYSIYFNSDESERSLLGTDLQSSDGVSIEWQVPPRFKAESMWAEAECGDRVVASGLTGFVSSGEVPPEGQCVVASNNIGALNIHDEPDRQSNVSAVLVPGVFGRVIERTSNGWYRIETDEARSMSAEAEAYASGWIEERQGIYQFGPCEQVPFTYQE